METAKVLKFQIMGEGGGSLSNTKFVNLYRDYFLLLYYLKNFFCIHRELKLKIKQYLTSL